MARISVDNQTSEFAPDPNQKLGDVLDNVLATLPPNRVVTGIELDGRYISRTEESSVRTRPAHTVAEISIKTSDREIWAQNGVDIALSCLERVKSSLIRVAEMLRDQRSGKAHHYFAQCMEGLERFTETMMITRCALRLDYDAIKIDGLTLAQVEHQFSAILESILQCQEGEDYEGIADRVEYELLTNLCSWVRALEQIQRTRRSQA